MAFPESRSEQLRRRNRRVFGWSLGLAALLHAALFLAFPDIRSELMTFATARLVDGTPEFEDVRWIDVRFGPPVIHLADGELRREPPDRVLDVQRVDVGGLLADRDCAWEAFSSRGRVGGSVRLLVGPAGYVQYHELLTSFGGDCVDGVMLAVAEKLRYHWLPDDESPAPVELVQPIWAAPSE